jgi:hypothetical protein
MTGEMAKSGSPGIGSRRAFLRGVGVTIALPALECMNPALGSQLAPPPRRMLLVSNNLGVLPKPFFPAESGADYKLSPYLDELRDFREDFTVFSGLSHPDVVGGHSTENCFLTAARGPTRSGFRNQISLDQFAAEVLGQRTRFATLNLGVNLVKAKRSLSWTRDGALLPAEDSPAALFRKMFVQGDRRAVQLRLNELRLRGSILDAVTTDTRQFSQSIGRDDRDRLDQYLNSVRELEQRLQIAGEWETRPRPTIDRDPPRDILDAARFFEKFELMLSMAQLALESDSTRIVTLMVDAFETPVFQVDDETKSINAYHNLSHHGQVPEKVSQLEAVDRRQMGLLRTLLENLTAASENSQRMLDSTMVLYGSNMGDSNTHDNTNLPILLAGGGFRHGQHLAFDHDDNTPLCNLFLTLLHQLGVEADAFGSSTGTLTGLHA